MLFPKSLFLTFVALAALDQFCHSAGLDDDCCDNVSCTTDNSECRASKCACKEYTHFREHDQCLSKDLEIICADDSQCSAENTECNNGICSCKKNFYKKDQECLRKKGLGTDCTVDNECRPLMKCLSGKCECISETTTSAEKTTCVELKYKLQEVDKQCQISFSNCLAENHGGSIGSMSVHLGIRRQQQQRKMPQVYRTRRVLWRKCPMSDGKCHLRQTQEKMCVFGQMILSALTVKVAWEKGTWASYALTGINAKWTLETALVRCPLLLTTESASVSRILWRDLGNVRAEWKHWASILASFGVPC